jgi:hypothetical protein|tara:strand:+ start:128 stop:235 length:108 start_codon:yes stop_codon:yes gene_type:complete
MDIGLRKEAFALLEVSKIWRQFQPYNDFETMIAKE